MFSFGTPKGLNQPPSNSRHPLLVPRIYISIENDFHSQPGPEENLPHRAPESAAPDRTTKCRQAPTLGICNSIHHTGIIAIFRYPTGTGHLPYLGAP